MAHRPLDPNTGRPIPLNKDGLPNFDTVEAPKDDEPVVEEVVVDEATTEESIEDEATTEESIEDEATTEESHEENKDA